MKKSLLLSFVLAAGCAVDPGPTAEVEGALNAFDINLFKQSIQNQIGGGKVVGYAYTVYKWGAVLGSGWGGHAVLADGVVPSVLHSPNRTQDSFSMSKTVSGVAMLKAIEEKGLDVMTKIAPYFPSDWVRGPHVAEMTFRDVLTHSTGLDEVGGLGTVCSFAALKQMVKNGATDARFHKLQYNNGGFCLLRILVPYVVYGPAAMKVHEDHGVTNAVTGSLYVDYVQTKLFEPLGITADVVPSGPTPYTRYYNYNNQSIWQSDPTGSFPVTDCGASYWNLSSTEFAHFIDALFGWQILSSAMVNVMTNTTTPDPAPNLQHTRLGMWRDESGQPFYKENGGPGQINGSGASTVWMRFPSGISVVLYINSIGSPAGGDGPVAEPVVYQAYYDAT